MESVGARAARYEPPSSGRIEVVRPRLSHRLWQRFTLPVTVVVAPAGLGKTTLLSQAVAENRLVPRGVDCWLTCTPDDAVASTLAAGLAQAVGLEQPPAEGSAVDGIVEAMWHRSPHQVALVLDDIHEVAAGSPGAALLAQLVGALSRNGHVVLAGRDPLPLPVARLEVRGEVLRVGEADLLFTDEELAAFAAQRQVPGSQVTGSGGWPALAELAASAYPGVEATYLWEEVLAGIEPEARHDLALLAHVGAFDDGLAAAALGHDVDLETLLARLPLVSSTSGGARSIHGLWRPFLARVVGGDEVGAARRRTGLALAEAGDSTAAVRLLAEADAWDAVTDVLLDSLGVARPPLPADVVEAWAERLPAEVRHGPIGLLLEAIDSVRSDPDRAIRLLDDAAAGFREAGHVPGELACIAQLAQIAWWWEQPERMLSIVVRILELEAAGFEQAVPIACLARALVADLANDSTAALVELDRIPAGALNRTWDSMVDWLRSLSLNHLGRPAEALEAAERARHGAGPLHGPLIEAARCQALWFLGSTDDLLAALPGLVDRTAALGLRNYSALLALTCCQAFSQVGRIDEAAAYRERALGTVAPGEVPLVDTNLAIASASLAVARGDEGEAADALRDYLDGAPVLGMGHAAAPQQRSLAHWYVLVPESRATWDTAPLGPSFAQARSLAEAVVGLRATGRLGPLPELPPPDLVRALLPGPWATELALGAIATDRQDGWRLLDALWPGVQPDVRRRAEDPDDPLQRPARTALARLPVPPRGRLDLRLLGPVELRRDGALIDAPDWRRERVRSLLAHLVLRPSASREVVAADLWPTLDADAQSRNLRVTLTYLLRVLEPDRAERDATFFVRSHGGGLVLHRGEQLGIDVWSFDERAAAAVDADRQGAPSVALQLMEEAVTLWRDDPAELANEDWALADVEDRRMQVVELAVRAGELQLTKGAPDAARLMAEAALRADAWCDRGHRILVAAHAGLGDRRATARALDRYRATLRDVGLSSDEASRAVGALAASLRIGFDS